jgi:radical SAM superfamily enzyme YgiQ (UPF0313 family)
MTGTDNPKIVEKRECKDRQKERILLMILPFWDPLVPPQGIAHLKHFLQHHGCVVKTMDANTAGEFKEVYNRYFQVLAKYVPEHKRGNFYNIGHDVMRNHMLAHIHYNDEEKYIQLVKMIVYQTFFTHWHPQQVLELIEVSDIFYQRLEHYIYHALQQEKPDVLGLSVLRDTIGPSLFAFRLAKKKNPRLMTVMGGAIFSDHLLIDTPNFNYFLQRTPYIDKIIIGEGQILFLKLLQGQLPASRKVFTKKDIHGEILGYTPLNQPDLSDFHVKEDYPYLSAQASGSCPNQCSFCNVAAFFGPYREKEPMQVVREMRELYQKYGLQLFFMNDSLVNHVATPLSKELIKAGLSLYWDAYLRVDDAVCDHDTTLLWRRGGFYRARMGIESGSQHVLDLMGKHITPQQSCAAMASLANAGIKTTAYVVIGHPGESEEDFQQTLQLIEESKNDIFEAECNPFIYGYAGQANTETWKDKRKLLYPEEAKEMLLLQSWTVDEEPSREVTYRRVCRFSQHCNRLGIPNPYSLHDIYRADERWKELHKNAVPRLVDFKDSFNIDENIYVKKIHFLQNSLQDEGDFDF